jgi:hypothetical protein
MKKALCILGVSLFLCATVSAIVLVAQLNNDHAQNGFAPKGKRDSSGRDCCASDGIGHFLFGH